MPRSTVQGATYRFTALTSRLVRMEHSESGVFVDEPSQLAVDRELDGPEVEVVTHDGGGVEILTEHLRISYDGGPFTPSGLSVTMRTRAQATHRTTWRYGDEDRGLPGRPGNLGGTVRTLDDVDGAVDLGTGLLSAHGFAVVDDSTSMLLTEDGWVRPRPAGAGQDLYFFGYGRDYAAALRDYFRLAGPTPLLPRYALGNWWSRYHRYSDAEYLALMDRFAAAGIPFSVAVIDMDWHLVDIDPRLGSGWTGYTWNRDLFADPEAFLAALHGRGLRVTLNVHPADGVRAHEEAYADVARDLGIDPAEGVEIPFDITSRAFVESYLRRLHHPHEDIGVDFWWLDWQSGSYSRVPGLDPLWLLNHVHFTDSAREGRRPLILSRYAGHGSHRYPVGFSGDTVTSWESLRFQPEFTATASNVGYFWWSHDIGGHLGGAKDNELAARWAQLGAVSPINRLHSMASPFSSKEPWRFSAAAERAMTAALRLRHRLVPYLYTLNWQAHAGGVAPTRPLYYEHPHADEAYTVPNEFHLGPALLVAPVTEPVDAVTHRAAVDAWLPPGTWFDLLDLRRYDGGSTGRRVTFHRPLDAFPLLARAGSVVPLAADPMAPVEENPRALHLLVLAGADGSFTLIEDDGAGAVAPADRQETELAWREAGGGAELRVAPPRGPGALARRELTIDVVGVASASVRALAGACEVPATVAPTAEAALAVGGDAGGAPAQGTSGAGDAVEATGEPAERRPAARALRIALGEVDLAEGLTVTLTDVRAAAGDLAADAFALLDDAEIEFATKERAYRAVRELDGAALAAALHALDLPGNLYGALLELLGAAPTP